MMSSPLRLSILSHLGIMTDDEVDISNLKTKPGHDEASIYKN